MSNTIADNLARLQAARTDIANAITEMGGTVNTGDGFEAFPADIETIPTGGGDIQFSYSTGYITNSSSYVNNSLNVYNSSSCSIVGANSTSNTIIVIPIITTSSNVFICFPIRVGMKSSAYNASVSYMIPSNYPKRYGYNANTMTLYYYYSATYIYTGSCTVSSSKFNFYVNNTSGSPFDFEFGSFVLKFDKT